MIFIVIRDGGTVLIGEKQIFTWEYLYPNVDVKEEITKLDKRGDLRRFTANGVLKYINKHLNNINQRKDLKNV